MTDTYTIRTDQFLPYTSAQVWRVLTDPDLMAKWLMPNDFQLEVGHHFTFNTVPIPPVKFEGTVYCERIPDDESGLEPHCGATYCGGACRRFQSFVARRHVSCGTGDVGVEQKMLRH